MKIRFKFSKQGTVRFVGHLDLLRYFQKAVVRSGIKAVYTNGYSPHMILSFASPLGVGLESTGEYFDLETAYTDPFADADDPSVNEYFEDIGFDRKDLLPCPPSAELVRMLDDVMAEGIRILSAVRIGESRRENAMALIHDADYRMTYAGSLPSEQELKEALSSFLSLPSIEVEKETKKTTRRGLAVTAKTVDIKPMIRMGEIQKDGLFLRCAAGSSANLKPELFAEAFLSRLGIPFDRCCLFVTRVELYDAEGRSLEECGRVF